MERELNLFFSAEQGKFTFLETCARKCWCFCTKQGVLAGLFYTTETSALFQNLMSCLATWQHLNWNGSSFETLCIACIIQIVHNVSQRQPQQKQCTPTPERLSYDLVLLNESKAYSTTSVVWFPKQLFYNESVNFTESNTYTETSSLIHLRIIWLFLLNQKHSAA